VNSQDKSSAYDEEAIYADAWAEVKSGTVRPGLWAKAFSESQGDDSKSQALYIKLRVQAERDRRRQEAAIKNVTAPESARQRLLDSTPDDSEPWGKDFFERLANGDLGLARTYWLCGVLVALVVSLISSFITSTRVITVFMAIYTIGYGVPWALGTWRAARKYEGPKIWAVLARVAIVLSVIGMVITLLILFGLPTR
jgi:hypothetical protein